MNFKRAINIFTNQFPSITVLRCINYNDEYYVIEAVENPNSIDYNLPYYAVNKHNGKVTSFIPTLDMDAFFEAVEKRTVYSTY